MRRLTAEENGYGKAWRKVRTEFLAVFTQCVLCGAKATVPDHHPKSRKQLIREGVKNPDAFDLMRPLCRRCHAKETAKHQPGGWNQR